MEPNEHENTGLDINELPQDSLDKNPIDNSRGQTIRKRLADSRVRPEFKINLIREIRTKLKAKVETSQPSSKMSEET